MKNSKLVYCLTALACVCCISCQNPIIEKWWVEKEQEPEYIPITKNIPMVTQVTVYDTIKEQVIQYVPQYIYTTIIKEKYVDVYKEVR